MTYKIIRFFFNSSPRTIKKGLTLEEAQEHCRRDDTHGDGWFDGYEREWRKSLTVNDLRGRGRPARVSAWYSTTYDTKKTLKNLKKLCDKLDFRVSAAIL